MTERFELKLDRSGDQIDFTAFGRHIPEAGTALQPRQRPGVDLDQIERLRQGDAPLGTVTQLSQLVSSWLLGLDLNPQLETAVNALGEEQLRVIFHIDERLRKDAELGDLLADLPFELLTLQGDIVPLVLSPRIAAFIHRLSKVPSARPAGMPRTAPLRVLMVHANPLSLGGQVPSPAPLRDAIEALAAEVGPNLVEVDILTREAGPGVIGEPTRDGLWQALRGGIYHVLVFLGHGGREQLRDDVLPLALLYLESEDGSRQNPVRADVLATELHNNPIPVVLLVGCLTAAEVPAGERDSVLGAMPVAMRGNQGMAQALVNSSSGVQVAVGMRYRLESDDALDFLGEFFESLLRTEPGDVDAAVHAGRERLHAADRFPGTYSAPVVYRVMGEEPMFGFLAAPPQVVVKEKFQKPRTIFWQMIAAAGSEETVQAAGTALANVDAELVADMVAQAPLLLPVYQIAGPNEAVEMPVRLHGTLTPDVIEGKLVIEGEGVAIAGVVASDAARNSGYRVLPEIEGSEAFFRIQPRDDHDGSPLPEGEIMTVTVQVGDRTGVVYPVRIEILEVEPHAVIGPVNNAVIVPPAAR
jgi:hypothetical protein